MPGRLAATSLPGQVLSKSKSVFHNKNVYNSVQHGSRDLGVKASVQTNPMVSPPDYKSVMRDRSAVIGHTHSVWTFPVI